MYLCIRVYVYFCARGPYVNKIHYNIIYIYINICVTGLFSGEEGEGGGGLGGRRSPYREGGERGLEKLGIVSWT